MTKIECDDGKYTFINNDERIKILRYRQEWFDDSVDNIFPGKAIHSLIHKCKQQENRIKELEQEISYLNIRIGDMT